MKQDIIPRAYFDWLQGASARETARMEKHQASKLQSDLKTYLIGYEMAIKDALIEAERLADR